MKKPRNPVLAAAARNLALAATLFIQGAVWANQTPDGPLDLRPIDHASWGIKAARHLYERAGFGASAHEVEALSRLGPETAVKRFLMATENSAQSPDFQHSGIFDDSLDPFPASRPAATLLAKRQGHALGVSVKPGGNRPLQPVVDRFFYWLRASRLETDRVAYWWGNRMLTSPYALREKMALFWHGHFAANEDKVRDYRKMLRQVQLFQRLGTENFRDLLLAVAKDPAMLVFLDAGVNTKAAPNENFAREIVELFTMGVGEYGEEDVRQAARAFTGWSVKGLEFYVDPALHDEGEKTFLGRSGRFDGEEIIDLILDQPVTATFIATKLYRYFVYDQPSAAAQRQLGQLLTVLDYDIGEFLGVLFRSRDFYQHQGSHIKSPVELVISTYRKLGLDALPGVPDFNLATERLGQRLLHPPTVAGWSQGRSWITPSLLFERGNFILDVLSPDIGFIPPDRFPSLTPEVARVQQRLRQGMSVSEATRPTGIAEGANMAQSNRMADADEAFNTRLGSMRGWQMALQRVKPISRHTASLSLTEQVMQAGCQTPDDVVAYFEDRFFSTPISQPVRQTIAEQFATEVGTLEVRAAASYMEEALRSLLHTLLSQPEYQLG